MAIDRYPVNVKLPELYLVEKYNLQSQLDKVSEELDELKEAIAENDLKKIWEELPDFLQAALGLFQMVPVDKNNPHECVQKAFKEHYDKLNSRAARTDEETIARKRDLQIIGEFQLQRI